MAPEFPPDWLILRSVVVVTYHYPRSTIPVPATVRGAAPHACGGGEARGGIGEVN
eukprot:COSAG01_NODE_40442_length_463_cov_1.986264_1_plen_54_part_01